MNLTFCLLPETMYFTRSAGANSFLNPIAVLIAIGRTFNDNEGKNSNNKLRNVLTGSYVHGLKEVKVSRSLIALGAGGG